MKKGFTLIELLGVIVILGILVLIAFPPLLNQIKKSKKEIKDSTKLLIIDAAKDYYENNINNYENIEGISYCVNISTLIENNYLNENLKNEDIDNLDTTQKVKMTYHNNKFNYEVIKNCTYYTVTFDANGGIINTNSKEVIENSAYGELPIPTREGYTFIGWNGKNLVDKNNITSGYYIDQNGEEQIQTVDNDWNHSDYIEIESGKTYTFSTDSSSGTEAKHCVYDENKNFIQSFNSGSNSMVMPSNAEYIRLSFRADSNNMQLEESPTATEYEPYYITPFTTVTQKKNHTLKAMWQANS